MGLCIRKQATEDGCRDDIEYYCVYCNNSFISSKYGNKQTQETHFTYAMNYGTKLNVDDHCITTTVLKHF